MKSWMSLAAVALAACAFAGLADASPPTRSHQVVPVTTVYEPCGAVEEVTYTIDSTRYFDQNGNHVRTVAHVKFEGTITVPRTGETVAQRGSQRLEFLPDGTFEFSGVAFNVHVPGQGVILLEAGRLILDGDGNVVKQSAKTSVDLAAKVCGALG